MAALIVGDLASLDLSVAVIAKMGFEGALNSVKRKRATTEKKSFTQRMKMGQGSNIKAGTYLIILCRFLLLIERVSR